MWLGTCILVASLGAVFVSSRYSSHRDAPSKPVTTAAFDQAPSEDGSSAVTPPLERNPTTDGSAPIASDTTNVPHARECIHCDSCIVSETPEVRYDRDTWFTPGSKEQLLDPTAPQASHAAGSGRPDTSRRHLTARWPHGLGEQAARGSDAGPPLKHSAALDDQVQELALVSLIPRAYRYKWGKPKVKTTQHVERCPVCTGCAHNLTSILEPITFAGVTFPVEAGKTSAHVFRSKHPHSPTGEAVAKVHCIPYHKDSYGPINSPGCSLSYVSSVMAALMAQQKLSLEGGFDSIIPRTWVGPVNAWSPDGRVFIDWDAVWLERAPGISLTALTSVVGPRQPAQKVTVDRAVVRDILQHKVKSTDIVLNAIWDLMTSQADTHGENIFIDIDGNMAHVDIDEAFGHRGIPSGFNSLFLPTSQENAINALGHDFVLKQPNGRPPKQPTYSNPREFSIQYLLDYRCHAKGGVIGKDYPEKVRALLGKLSKMTPHQVQLAYGLAEHTAQRLQRRATDMLHKGFEWTLRHGLPRNPDAHFYPITPPCCSATIGQGDTAICDDPKYVKWVDPDDALPCGDEWTAANPAKIYEPICRDPDGRRRVGLWERHDFKLSKGWPLSEEAHLESNPKTPVHGKWVELDDPAWAYKHWAGRWAPGTLDTSLWEM